MSRYRDLKNERFGSLVALEYKFSKGGNAHWLCRCDCGNEKVARASNLMAGYTQTCGCKNTFQTKTIYGDLIVNDNYIYKMKYEANRRGFEFKIDKDYLQKLYDNQNYKCSLSGLEIRFANKAKIFDNQTASLDRIDNKKGYIEGNVQWVHKFINQMKFKFPQQLFIELCQAVSTEQASKKH